MTSPLGSVFVLSGSTWQTGSDAHGSDDYEHSWVVPEAFPCRELAEGREKEILEEATRFVDDVHKKLAPLILPFVEFLSHLYVDPLYGEPGRYYVRYSNRPPKLTEGLRFESVLGKLDSNWLFRGNPTRYEIHELQIRWPT